MNPVEPCRCIMPDEYFSQAHDPLDPLWMIASPMPPIFSSVTALSASFVVVTDLSASFAASTDLSTNLPPLIAWDL